MASNKIKISKTGGYLALFVIIAISLLMVVQQLTVTAINDNKRQATQQAVTSLVANISYDNNVLTDTVLIPASQQLGTSAATTAYRVRHQGVVKAIIITVITHDGYNGKIELLLGLLPNGAITGVRIVQHRETPGLGDRIEPRKSNWLSQFLNRSLTNPLPSAWAVKKDGGDFDQLTGATVTPRAIVTAIKKALHYVHQHQDRLYHS